VFAEVVEHIDERVPHFAGRREEARMEAISPDATVSVKRTVDRLGDPDCESLDPAREASRVVSFHQQVQMISLNAELQNTEPIVAGHAEGGLDHCEGPSGSQRGKASGCSQRDVGWATGVMWSATRMRNHAAPEARLAARVASAATPRAEVELSLVRHLDSGHIAN
jgi:hypothetical protein